MEIETVEDLATFLADRMGIYGGCKSNGEEGCTLNEKEPFCCRAGFCQAIEDRIRKAVENDNKLNQVGLNP